MEILFTNLFVIVSMQVSKSVLKIRFMNISIHDTFTPGDTIDNPEKFAGRKGDIERALLALSRKGCSLMVYGERGVGKSSFSNMIKKIAQGDDYLIYKYKFHKVYEPNRFIFRVASVTCDSMTKSVEDVLQRLITSPDGLRNIFKYKVEYIESEDGSKFGININPFSSTENSNVKYKISYYKEQSIFEIFTNIIIFIKNNLLRKNEGLLIHIDEFDRVENKGPLASLIKSLSKDNIKFLISGIATDYKELLLGHQSIVRQLYQGRIKINPMTRNEMDALFDLASEQNKKRITFNSSFRDMVYNISQGLPYFIQLSGQLALDSFSKTNLAKRGSINSEHLKSGLNKLVEYEPELDDLYFSIIGDKKEREILLKGIASQFSKRVSRRFVNEYCKKRNLINSKGILTQLLAFRDKNKYCGNEQIIKSIGNDYVSFTSILFKLFVRSRESIFD